MTIDGDNFATAIGLLSDDELVWSEDFEAIREPLKNLLLAIVVLGLSGLATIPGQLEQLKAEVNRLTAAIVKAD